ncbi:hypothetical protein [Sediminicurvatus halobius]|uniref:hypothetical protein n=1 Tax=Sediminicurvatus halobius TaxID=2182432 RepID=UPI0011B27F58|nr:hypothetical protein [Spiribacter halobius]UEX76636.1 hypothetical protein LMH63_11795 [Spiribacter halobius]
MAERRAEEERLRALVRTSFPVAPLKPVDPEALSLSEGVYLLAVTRAAATEDYERIKPIADSPTLLSPRAEFDRIILERLSRNALLCVDPDSILDAFDFRNGAVHLRRPRRVAYKCAFAPTTEARGWLIDQLEAVFASGHWPEHWRSELPEVVSLIGIEQCIAYLELQQAERDLPFRAGTKTRAMFQRMLEHHSLAQAFNHIWVAARYAADHLVRSRISRSHAANSAVSFLNTRMERARHEHWNLKPFRPDPRCCRCTVVDVLNNTVLNLGDLAFTRSPL